MANDSEIDDRKLIVERYLKGREKVRFPSDVIFSQIFDIFDTILILDTILIFDTNLIRLGFGPN